MPPTILHLTGPAARGARVEAAVLRELLDVLVDAVRESVRLRAEGRSRAGGPMPAWLERAAAFDVELQAGSTQLVLEARALGQAVPEKLAQLDMFEPLDPSGTCLDLFAAALDDALAGTADSERFDDNLIDTLTRFGRVLERGVDALELRSGGARREIARRSVDALQRLRRRIPADQRVRVAGTLDLLKHSSRIFALRVSDGELRGVIAYDADYAELGKLLGQRVVVAGTAKFRPSGKVLRVEAELVAPAVGDVRVWEALPVPLLGALDARALRVPQGPRSGVAALFGQWPGADGDDDDDALERELRALS